MCSPRRHNVRLLSIPLDLAAQPVSVLVKDPVRRNRALVPVLDPPQYSPDLLVDRARAQVRDRNQFALHRVREIRRDGGGVRRTQCDLLALFQVWVSQIAKTPAPKSSRELEEVRLASTTTHHFH